MEEEKNFYSIDDNSIPKEYIGIDLLKSGFDVNKMTEKEKKFYDYLLDREAEKYMNANSDEDSKQDVKNQISAILSNDSFNNSKLNIEDSSPIISFRSAPWWHLNTVSKVGSALNVAIGGIFASLGGGLASSGIRALIKKVGENEAKKIVKNQVLNKLKNKLLIWGMTGTAKKLGNGALQIIMWAADPGTRIAEMIDANDAHPNNGYIEAW